MDYKNIIQIAVKNNKEYKSEEDQKNNFSGYRYGFPSEYNTKTE